MEELIKQAFLHVDVIGPHVHQGHYDLEGPGGEIMLPQIWETMIQPDWAITMHMWPVPEPPPPPPKSPGTVSPPHPPPEPPNLSEPEAEFPQAEEMASPPTLAELASKLSGESAPRDDPPAEERKHDVPTKATNINGHVKGKNAREEPPGENNSDSDS